MQDLGNTKSSCTLTTKISSFFIFLIALLCIQNLTTATPTTTSTLSANDTDYLALLTIKSRIIHDPQGPLGSWNASSDFCQWQGVTCSRQHRRVTVLDLSSRGLSGSLSPQIGNLSFLRELRLQNNTLEGVIPPQIGGLFRLQILLLNNNSFEGELPASLSNCTSLTELRVSRNKLVGKLPEELGSLVKLAILNIHVNNFTGGIPPYFGNLTSLQTISAFGNPLGGSIPHTLGQLQNLQTIGFGRNQLSDDNFGSEEPDEMNFIVSIVPQVKGMSPENFCVHELSNLTAISPLDGRYWNKVKDLARYLSEYGLIYYRNLVEVKWLLKLSLIPEVTEVPNFSKEAQLKLQGLIDEFSITDALEVKKIEKITNHDVKAVEYFLKKKCQKDPEIAKVLEFFHFGCTSEDINNLAHGLMLKEAINLVILPVMDDLVKAIYNMAKANAQIPMLSRTHGQPASPTTLGKEMLVFAERLSIERQDVCQANILGKFAGAVGNYNTHVAAYPDVNWPPVAEEFVTSLGLSLNPHVTQHFT